MTSPATLTTEQLDALLHQPEQANPDAELTSLRAVLTDLRTASVAAAEHHHRYASITPARGRTHRALWALATTAVIACAALPLGFHHHAVPIKPIAIATQQPAPTVSDDALFADIQADVDASVPSPLLPLTTDIGTTNSTTQRTQNER